MSSNTTNPHRKQGRRKNNKKDHPDPANKQQHGSPPAAAPESVATVTPAAAAAATDAESVDDAATCWICAEPVKYYALSECNHRTCHVCCLRLRALYKKRECTFCKAPQPLIVQTVSPDAPFDSFNEESTPFRDPKLAIAFETQEMMEDTLLLLRFNCPESDCPFFGTGWSDLKQHVRAAHKTSMCHICIGAKKIFAHEHTLYSNAELPIHIPSMRRREKLPQGAPTDVEGGVHPLCEFCNQCFFSDEELYPHMRDRHEKCFVCERQGNKFVYFRNYEELEAHFENAHFPCSHPTCREQKFVVFGSQLDLKAHTMDAHGSDLTAKDRRDARRVAASDFSFQAPDNPSRPNGAGAPAGRRRNGFGAALTLERSEEPSPPQQPPRREEPAENLDPALAARQGVFLLRLNPGAAMAVHASMRAFRASETTARDVISTLFNVLERELDATGVHVNALVEAFPDDKRRELLTAWNDFRVEHRREFPDLVPQQAAQGSEYSGIAAGRVLHVKHNATARSGAQSRRVWDRVAQAAASTSTPSASSSTLPSSSRSSVPQPSASFPALGLAPRRAAGGGHTTPWTTTTSSSSSTQSFRPAAPTAPAPPPPPEPRPPGPTRKPSKPAPALSNAAFPSLPSAGPSVAQTLRQQGFLSGNQSARNIIAATQSTPSASAWGARAPETTTEQEVDAADSANAPGRAKKKGKQKQTLFTIGAFPA